MHLLMFFTALSLAFGLRFLPLNSAQSWVKRWLQVWFLFLFPSLLVLMTAIAILFMGPNGKMFGIEANWFSYLLALTLVIWSLIALIKQGYLGWKTVKNLSQYHQELIAGKKTRILNTNIPYSAQIGFWIPELVVSQGLLNILDEQHLQAVLAHEEAHYYYHDTFCFFWLGWLRLSTFWLPNTEIIWQELLLLRETRADCWAIKNTDPLLLAESLLIVAKNPLISGENLTVALDNKITRDRLTERIDLILNPNLSCQFNPWKIYLWIGLTIVPLLTLPWHY